MLIFTYKLEKYIKRTVFPQILLDPNKYSIKGSFRRRIPYVTDVDVVNDVHPKYHPDNIYRAILKLMERLSNETSDVILVCITCGIDERFGISTGSNEELDRIKSLLEISEIKELDSIAQRYANNIDKKIFYINEMIWKFYKIRWTPENVLANEIILRGGIKLKFEDVAKKNSSLLLQYYVKIGLHMLGVDVIVVYDPINMQLAYQRAADYQLKLANYNNEYYFMLFPFKFYFRNDKKILKRLEDIIEKKYGLYKQLLVRIDTYHILYKTGNLDIHWATIIVEGIVRDLKQIHFRSNVVDRIRKISSEATVKMEQWFTLLDVLYDEINLDVNTKTKHYFFEFLELVSDDKKGDYYLEGSRECEDTEILNKCG